MNDLCLQERYAPNNQCFGCGPKNERGLRVRSFVEGDALVATFRPELHHQAFAGVLNGGIVGAVLDCHSNWAAAYGIMLARNVDEPPCTVTGDFHVVLKRPTSLDAEVSLWAKVVQLDGDKAIVEATMTSLGKITATCKGTFVAVKEGHPAFHRW